MNQNMSTHSINASKKGFTSSSIFCFYKMLKKSKSLATADLTTASETRKNQTSSDLFSFE